MEVNMIAAAEIARQLRLRDMGGIIVVDFSTCRILKIENIVRLRRNER
jgi:Ribonuclease G/E